MQRDNLVYSAVPCLLKLTASYDYATNTLTARCICIVYFHHCRANLCSLHPSLPAYIQRQSCIALFTGSPASKSSMSLCCTHYETTWDHVSNLGAVCMLTETNVCFCCLSGSVWLLHSSYSPNIVLCCNACTRGFARVATSPMDRHHSSSSCSVRFFNMSRALSSIKPCLCNGDIDGYMVR